MSDRYEVQAHLGHVIFDGDPTIALGDGLQRFEHEQRETLGQAHELVSDLGMPGFAGQEGDGLLRQGPSCTVIARSPSGAATTARRCA